MIKVEALNFAYDRTGKRALDQVSFNVGKGEIFGFLGPSGAGKTTTQRLIIGLLRGYDGQVKIMGKERRDWCNRFYEEVGVAFDFPNMYLKLTGEENLRLMASYYRNECLDPLELMDRVGLLKDKDKRVESYSKGMKMRLNFIRSLLHDPQILFLDEPTSGLDPANAKNVKDMILELKAVGKTVFLTTHDMNVADQICDRIGLIDEGQIKALDAPSNLKHAFGKANVTVCYRADAGLTTRAFDLADLRDDEAFFKIMRTNEIHSIHSGEATLEDVFLHITGRELI